VETGLSCPLETVSIGTTVESLGDDSGRQPERLLSPPAHGYRQTFELEVGLIELDLFDIDEDRTASDVLGNKMSDTEKPFAELVKTGDRQP
jgi:hypothetical protein